MGVDVFCLITDWEPAIASYRAARGLGFYWDANVARNERYERVRTTPGADLPSDIDALPELPFLVEQDLPGGKRYLETGEYYDAYLRPHLPADLRGAAEAVYGMVVIGSGYPWMVPDQDRDDLHTDAALRAEVATDVVYSMRPSTVRQVLAAATQVPWDELALIGEQHPVPSEHLTTPGERWGMSSVVDYWTFEWHVRMHLECLAEAARAERGVVTLVSQ